jgi:hypothetical protein
MLKSNVAYSTNKSAYEAGKEVAKGAVADLGETKVAFLFTSVKYTQKDVIKGVKEVIGTAPLIGCTSSAGILVPDGFITGKDGYAGMLAIGDSDTAVGVAASERGKNPRETGRKVALEAMKKVGTDHVPAYYFMVASPAEEEEYEKGIADVIGEVPFFGGSAADDAVAGEWKIFTGEKEFSDGVAVAFFYTNKPMKNKYTGEFHETVNAGVVTKMNGKRQIVEINGIPALKQYCKWTGQKEKDLMGMNILGKSVVAPLGVKDRLGSLTAIRHPMVANKDLSINVGNTVTVNTAVIQMQASTDELINATGKTLKTVRNELPVDVGAYLLIHCGGRRLQIDSRIDEVAKQLKKESKGVPFIGAFTFGEYGSEDHGQNTCGGLMLSFTGFGATEKK